MRMHEHFISDADAPFGSKPPVNYVVLAGCGQSALATLTTIYAQANSHTERLHCDDRMAYHDSWNFPYGGR